MFWESVSRVVSPILKQDAALRPKKLKSNFFPWGYN